MALAPRLEFRQGQALVMTPQLLQAIKLLQLSAIELASYVEAELERNPLIEREEPLADSGPIAPDEAPAANDTPREGDWAADDMRTDRGAIENDLGTGLENAFPDDAAPARLKSDVRDEPSTFGAFETGMRSGGTSFDDDAYGLDSVASADISLQAHLERQLGMRTFEPGDRLIGMTLIAAIDNTGWLGEPVDGIAERLGVPAERVLALLAAIQSFEPAGVGARSLSECLALQLKDMNRLDPAMQALLNNLGLLAKRDFAALKKLCGVDQDDIADMVAEIRRLDPKPGLRFGGSLAQAVIPDVYVRAAHDGSWHVELNHDALPRVLLSKSYFARVSKHTKGTEQASFVDEAWTSANWLVRALDQRSKTILKVASEIVRQQDGFFAYGVTYLRPLNLKQIGEAVSLHESTISRVTSNKFMATPRGLFEMKYFFTAAISGADGAEAHSSEAVRHRIKQLVDVENANSVLSDDALVDKLREAGIEIARRTVAKYRDSLRIPSSAARRREKRTMARA